MEDLVLVSARQLVCKIHTVGVLDGLPLSTIFFLVVLGQSVRFSQLPKVSLANLGDVVGVDAATDFVVGRSHWVLELILVQSLVAWHSTLTAPLSQLL